MDSPHKLDFSRLDLLRAGRDAAVGALQARNEEILELRRQRGVVEAEARRLQSDVEQVRQVMDSRNLRRKLREFDDKRDEFNRQIEELRAALAPLEERRNAIGRLYQRCANFVEEASHV